MLFCLLLSSLLCPCFAQNNTDGIVRAEKSFAAYSVKHGTKAAFLQFADSNGLVFEGANAVRAIESWAKRDAGTGVLNWHPVYAFTAASGEIGFTTGPWTFHQPTIADSVAARGQYHTIWHKTKKSEWKFLLDIGVTNTPAFDSATFSFYPKKIAFVSGTDDDLLEAEALFIEKTKQASGRVKGYLAVLCSDIFMLSRRGRLPATTKPAAEAALRSMPDSIHYQITGSGRSQSGDFGYVYGTAVMGDKKDSYLRIWRREGKQWKLALEALPH